MVLLWKRWLTWLSPAARRGRKAAERRMQRVFAELSAANER
jgi:hypothetical protein